MKGFCSDMESCVTRALVNRRQCLSWPNWQVLHILGKRGIDRGCWEALEHAVLATFREFATPACRELSCEHLRGLGAGATSGQRRGNVEVLQAKVQLVLPRIARTYASRAEMVYSGPIFEK